MTAIPWSLFPYQSTAVDKIIEKIREGYQSPICVMPTGTGKTQTYLALIERLLNEGYARRIMILAHRKGLVEEPVQRLIKFFPQLQKDVGMVMANWNEPAAKIVACSRDTIARESMPRLREILKYGKIDVVITDECHEFGYGINEKDSPNPKIAYKLREYLREVNPSLIEVGFTATPRENQGHIWDCVAEAIDLSWAVDNGYLADPLWFPVQVPIRLSDVKYKTNEYGEKEYTNSSIADVMETSNWCASVVQKHLDSADRSGPSLAFTVSVEAAEKLSDAFNAAGVKSMWISGEFDPQRRREVMAAVLSGEVEVVCNCAIWTVGTDIPPIRNLHLARPTNSLILYTQMIGRGLRLFNGKTQCRIFEYTDFSSINLLEEDRKVWIGKILGIPASMRAVVKQGKDGNLTGLAYTQGEGVNYLSGDPAELITIQIDRLKRSKWTWVGEGNEWLMLPIGKWSQDQNERTYLVPPPGTPDIALYAYVKKAKGGWFIGKVDGTDGLDYDRLLEIAEGRARVYGDPYLAARGGAWRSEPVSEKQLQSFGWILNENMTQGEASDAITKALMTGALEKKGFVVAKKEAA